MSTSATSAIGPHAIPNNTERVQITQTRVQATETRVQATETRDSMS